MKDTKKVIFRQSSQLDKTSWLRKYENLQTLINQVNVLAEQIAEIEASKEPIIDQINDLRQQMVHECIHPIDHLVDHEGVTLCKFCEKRIAVL
jgi:hypothetical protein